MGIQHRQSYPAAVRNFCIALKNTSPAAYRFFRTQFDEKIPAPITIRGWHANADINSEPGMLKQSLEIIKLRVAEKEANNEKLLLGLLFDEMSIHKLVQFINGKMVGYEHVPGNDQRQAQIAKQAIVFMVSGINDDLNLPIAYYFINSLESDSKCRLLRENIEAVLNCGAILTNISFDGYRSNPVVCGILGANLDVFSDLFNTSFHIENHQIRVIFDPSHMQKLVRNTLGSKEILYDAQKRPIKWIYLKRLVKFKNQHNFNSMHKLTQAHIDYQSKPMKVILAVQTLSASTANAIEFLMQQGYPEFKGAEETIEFIRVFDKLFDVFNSTSNSSENPFKKKMSDENASRIFEMFDSATNYIKNLFIRNDSGKLVPICNSMNKTGFQGYVINIQSLSSIYKEMLEEKNYIDSIATHKLSQDHLEVFFGKIRSLTGSNNNPTCQQFTAAMRKLLANTAIQYSEGGNCTDLNPISVYNPYSNISTITSRRLNVIAETNAYCHRDEEMDEVLNELSDIQTLNHTNELTDLSDLTTAHVASIIEKHIESTDQFYCQLCLDVFKENEKVPTAFTSSSHARKPCQSTFDICKAADHILKLEILKGQFSNSLINQTILRSLNIENLYVLSNFEDHNDHKMTMIEYILRKYIRIKGNFIAKTVSFNEHQKNLRQKLSRLIINSNQ